MKTKLTVFQEVIQNLREPTLGEKIAYYARHFFTRTPKLKIAHTLEQACKLGPAHVTDFYRQKLTVLLFRLESGVNPAEAIAEFQKITGMTNYSTCAAKGEFK